MTTALETIASRKRALEDELDALDISRIDAIRAQRWTCASKACGRESRLSEVVLVRTHWYTGPHGCTGGDYWSSGERNLICPKCSARHRMIAQDPMPADYYDLPYDRRKAFDDKRQISMEREYSISDFSTRCRTFESIIDQYDGAFHAIRVRGRDVHADRGPGRMSATETESLYGLSAGTFAKFINV